MLKIRADKIKGIFALAEIIHEELGYSKEHLFSSDYRNDGQDCIVLSISKEKFGSSYNWTAEVTREEVDQPDNIDLIKAPNLQEIMILINEHFIPSDELSLKIFKKTGFWFAYLGYYNELGTLNGYEYRYLESFHEEDFVNYNDDSEYDTLEKAESSTMEGCLNRLEKIMELKIKND